MNVNIYYGGRGLMDDPTLFVINKMQEVLEELHVTVEKFNLYELKNHITTLPQTLKTADGIILATTIEWYGIGGYMQQFLDSCWLYGDKEKIEKIYMCPIVMATTYGEREGKLNLATAWEILGGRPCSGICGYISDTTLLEMNKDYITLIEKKAENMYRTINQRLASLPASNQAVKKVVSSTKNIDLTPQESEQLSRYASDDSYVQRQKTDIQELTSLFKDMMGTSEEGEEEYAERLKKAFKPQPGLKASYKIYIGNRKEPLITKINAAELTCRYGGEEPADVEIRTEKEIIDDIMNGRMTFQRAFMSGEMKMKGDFNLLRTLDHIFIFEEN
ncbi:MAG: SCP2 sterol-binding domain-containing protein [Lachnospiraceae bacterium]|nr:SCP2 sterol-binding domain-containing protein [Lachnospiraceae bacterium]